MEKVKIALVGIGGISQVVRIPSLKKLDDVELVALCDTDRSKVSFVADKFEVPRVYSDIQYLLKKETELNGIIICTPNNLHYPMALACLDAGLNTMVEKPLALSAEQAQRMVDKAEKKKVHLVAGMNNRFRDDAVILKDFMDKNELGQPFYVKSGWLKRWNRSKQKGWIIDKKIAGGGVMMDLGIQLIDLDLWLLGNPKIKQVKAYLYNLSNAGNVEDSGLVVIETENNVVVTVEVSWRMHLERSLSYTHFFGSEGGAFLNPLRLNKEMHGNLVNVSPMQIDMNVDIFKKAFESEIKNFVAVIKNESEPITPGRDGVYLMRIMDAVYESAATGKTIEFS